MALGRTAREVKRLRETVETQRRVMTPRTEWASARGSWPNAVIIFPRVDEADARVDIPETRDDRSALCHAMDDGREAAALSSSPNDPSECSSARYGWRHTAAPTSASYTLSGQRDGGPGAIGEKPATRAEIADMKRGSS